MITDLYTMILKNYSKPIYVVALTCAILLLVVAGLFMWAAYQNQYSYGLQSLDIIKQQLEFGPRYVGSTGHGKVRDMIKNGIAIKNLQVIEQSWVDTANGEQLQNIIARHNPSAEKRIILATHYDTDRFANKETGRSHLPVPGANDGASGVAILLSLAGELDTATIPADVGVDLVFFDAENFEPGNFNNWNPKGSEYFTKNLKLLYKEKPKQAIVVDMVCKQGLKLKREHASQQSAPAIYEQIWQIGKETDPTLFSDEIVSEIKDDHTNLIKAGIPSVLLIDMKYPFHNTTQDTLDKCNVKSLDGSYRVIKKFLTNYSGN